MVNLTAALENSQNQQGHLPNQSTRRQVHRILSVTGGTKQAPVLRLLGNS